MRKLIALVGLAVLGVGGYYVVQRFSKEIPQQLRERADAALRKANIVGVTVEMDGRDAVLKGAVPTAAQQETARSRIAAIPGVRGVAMAALKVQAPDLGPVDPTVVSPATLVDLVAVWRDGRLTLTGFITSRSLQERIAQKVAKAFDGAPVDQRLEVRAGEAPEQLVKLVAVGLQALSQASNGKLQVSGRSLKLSGTVKDEQTKRAMNDYLKGQVTPPVVLDVSIAVTPPVIAPITPDVVEAETAVAAVGTDADAGASADTAVAGQDTTQAAVDTAVAVDTTIAIDTAVAAVEADTEAAPPVDTMIAATPDTSAPEQDTVAPAEADTVQASDTAAPAAAPDTAPTAVVVAGDVPHGVDLSATSPLTTEQCQDIATWLIKGEKRITFTKRRNRLTPEDDAKVQVVASLMKRCVDSRVIVEAYMDSYGEPDALKAQTRRRAFNVKMRLIELGIDAKRIKIAGFGYNRPRYPNRKKTRHLNRRVEFKFKGVK